MSETLKFNETGDFAACNAAEKYLRDRGFSVGSMERGLPRGILFGDFKIAKWRNLSTKERGELHGAMTGDMRNGPVNIRIFDDAPNAALRAILMLPDFPPVRPEMPVEGRSLTEWAEHYRRVLSDWFRATNSHYADDAEWMIFVTMQYDYQQTRDEGFSGDCCE